MEKLKTLVEIADQSAKNIVNAQAEREDRRAANKAIHAAGGPQIAVWDVVAAGATTVAVAAELGLSLSTFNRWLSFMPERQVLYKAARNKAAQVIAEQTIQIADEATVGELSTARLRIEERWKLVERFAPNGFGIKNCGGDSESPITLEALQLRRSKTCE